MKHDGTMPIWIRKWRDQRKQMGVFMEDSTLIDVIYVILSCDPPWHQDQDPPWYQDQDWSQTASSSVAFQAAAIVPLLVHLHFQGHCIQTSHHQFQIHWVGLKFHPSTLHCIQSNFDLLRVELLLRQVWLLFLPQVLWMESFPYNWDLLMAVIPMLMDMSSRPPPWSGYRCHKLATLPWPLERNQIWDPKLWWTGHWMAWQGIHIASAAFQNEKM